ncbi:MAG TPA: phosphate/phosphite/phosphonate ABC transporter substrate-binding protein [Caulobacteraceae bacterium]|jgi:phosphonate transport system substrate-binding protein
MITRRHLGLSGAAAVGLAACGKPSTTGTPGELTFSILPTAPAATLQKNWQPVLDDMAKATGLKITPFIPANYSVLVQAMAFRKSDAGWFSNEAGLEAVRRANGEVFARTLGPNGVNGYQSLLIVNAKSKITLDSLKKCDKSLSFGQADVISTSGYVAPIAYFFGPNNIDPSKCFSTVRTTNHNANLLAVASGTLDVATNNSESLKLNRQSGRHEADQVKAIWTSPMLPEDPIIWRKDLDPAIKEKLRQFFITYARGDTPDAVRQRENLKPLGIGGFEQADNNHLLIVRQIDAGEKLALAKWAGDKDQIATAQKALDDVTAQLKAFEGRVGAPAGTQ